jgi:hypothetical protein
MSQKVAPLESSMNKRFIVAVGVFFLRLDRFKRRCDGGNSRAI